MMLRPRTVPPPLAFYRPALLLLGLAVQHPAGALADIASPVKGFADGLQPCLVTGRASKVAGQQPRGPVGAGDTDGVRVQVDHPPQLGLPGWRGRRSAARVAAVPDAIG